VINRPSIYHLARDFARVPSIRHSNEIANAIYRLKHVRCKLLQGALNNASFCIRDNVIF